MAHQVSHDLVRFGFGDSAFLDLCPLPDPRLTHILKALVEHLAIIEVHRSDMAVRMKMNGAEWDEDASRQLRDLRELILHRAAQVIRGSRSVLDLPTVTEEERGALLEDAGALEEAAAAELGHPAALLRRMPFWRHFFRHSALVDRLHRAFEARLPPEDLVARAASFIALLAWAIGVEDAELGPRMAVAGPYFLPPQRPEEPLEAADEFDAAAVVAEARSHPHGASAKASAKPQTKAKVASSAAKPSGFAGFPKGFLGGLASQPPKGPKPKPPSQQACASPTKSRSVQATSATHNKGFQTAPQLRTAHAQTGPAKQRSQGGQARLGTPTADAASQTTPPSNSTEGRAAGSAAVGVTPAISSPYAGLATDLGRILHCIRRSPPRQ